MVRKSRKQSKSSSSVAALPVSICGHYSSYREIANHSRFCLYVSLLINILLHDSYACTVCAMALCPFVCVLSQVRVLSKCLKESSSFLTWELPSTYPTLCFQKIRTSPKITLGLRGYNPNNLWNFAPNWTLKISPQQVDR